MRITKRHVEAVASVIALGVLFAASSYYAERYTDVISAFVSRGGVLAMVGYVFIVIVAVVVAPITSVPLVPVAAHVWGVPVAAFLSTVGAVAGAMIAFGIARKFGILIVKKIINENRLTRIQKLIPNHHIFWWVLVLRIVTPVDALSYAIGIFTKIKWKQYLLATTFGIIPFEIFYAYAGTLTLRQQLVMAAIAAPVIGLLAWRVMTSRALHANAPQ